MSAPVRFEAPDGLNSSQGKKRFYAFAFKPDKSIVEIIAPHHIVGHDSRRIRALQPHNRDAGISRSLRHGLMQTDCEWVRGIHNAFYTVFTAKGYHCIRIHCAGVARHILPLYLLECAAG